MKKGAPAIIPMNADVLMIGVDPRHFDHYQRMVKGGLQSMNMGWNYVANPAESFGYAIEFLAKRPELDLVFIANQVDWNDDELRDGVTALAEALAKHPAKPWVVLNPGLEWLRPAFLAEGVNVDGVSIEVALWERHRRKTESAEAA
ncbi:hypothetical protein C4556_02080 [Candidatus Parcubacteria bacterium]|nr:MAG: hypothetical protein C4556_02080 [Candidatus Parcubacteria bacterium]